MLIDLFLELFNAVVGQLTGCQNAAERAAECAEKADKRDNYCFGHWNHPRTNNS